MRSSKVGLRKIEFAYLISAILIISLQENKAREMSSEGAICTFRARREISTSL